MDLDLLGLVPIFSSNTHITFMQVKPHSNLHALFQVLHRAKD
jgi:hypothetical protein